MALPADVLVLQAAVNWRESYIVTYAFATDVLRSTNGSEQRLARRRAPRKTIAFTASMIGRQARLFEGQAHRGQGARYLIPETPMQVPAPQGMAAGAAAVAVAETPAWAATGTYAVLRDGSYTEGRTILRTAPGSISFAEISTYAWPPTTTVAPGRVGQMQAATEGQRLSSLVLEVPVNFTEAPGSEEYPVYYDATLTRGPTYNNRELFSLRPDWSGAPSVTYTTDRTTIDYDQGLVENYDLSNLRYRVVQFRFTQTDYLSAKQATDFFFRMKGQQRSFYLPTWSSDMELAAPFAAGATSIVVSGRDILDNIGYNDAIYRNIVLVTAAGLVPMAVRGATATPNQANTILNLVVPAPVSSDGVSMISWLNLVRFATDNLSVSWLTSTVAQFSMSFKTLPDVFDDVRINNAQITIGGKFLTISERYPLEESTNRLLFNGAVLLIDDNYVTIGNT